MHPGRLNDYEDFHQKNFSSEREVELSLKNRKTRSVEELQD
jgi:hypothetical protein